MKDNVLRFPGMPKRLLERLCELGYWRPDQKPDVGRFAEEKGYQTNYLYRWLDGVTPTWPYLERLCVDLGVTKAWLLLGEKDGPSPARRGAQAVKPIGGGRRRIPATRGGRVLSGSRDYVKWLVGWALPRLVPALA